MGKLSDSLPSVIIDEHKGPSAPRGGSDSSGFGSGKGEKGKGLYPGLDMVDSKVDHLTDLLIELTNPPSMEPLDNQSNYETKLTPETSESDSDESEDSDEASEATITPKGFRPRALTPY